MPFISSMGSTHPFLTPAALWAAFCVWSCVEVAFYFVLHYVIHPRLDPPREAPQGPLAPRESLMRLVDALERLKGASPRFLAGVGLIEMEWEDKTDGPDSTTNAGVPAGALLVGLVPRRAP
jgi:hypothetical protein